MIYISLQTKSQINNGQHIEGILERETEGSSWKEGTKGDARDNPPPDFPVFCISDIRGVSLLSGTYTCLSRGWEVEREGGGSIKLSSPSLALVSKNTNVRRKRILSK